MRFHIIQIHNFDGIHLVLVVIFDAFIDCAGEAAADDVIKFVTVGAYPFFGIAAGGNTHHFGRFVKIERGISINIGLFIENDSIFCRGVLGHSKK